MLEHKSEEKAIMHQRTFIKTIIDSLKPPAMIVGPSFEVLLMNQASIGLKNLGNSTTSNTRLI